MFRSMGIRSPSCCREQNVKPLSCPPRRRRNAFSDGSQAVNCQDFGEISRVATFIESLWDKVLRVLCGLLCERKLGNKPLELQNLPYSLDSSLQIAVDIESFLEPADSHADSRISGIAGG